MKKYLLLLPLLLALVVSCGSESEFHVERINAFKLDLSKYQAIADSIGARTAEIEMYQSVIDTTTNIAIKQILVANQTKAKTKKEEFTKQKEELKIGDKYPKMLGQINDYLDKSQEIVISSQRLYLVMLQLEEARKDQNSELVNSLSSKQQELDKENKRLITERADIKARLLAKAEKAEY